MPQLYAVVRIAHAAGSGGAAEPMTFKESLQSLKSEVSSLKSTVSEGWKGFKNSLGSERGSIILKEGKLEGEVRINPPKNATLAQIEQVKAYVKGANKALEENYISQTGRVSTKGVLRAEASRSANLERIRAEKAGTPYQGHAGHVPDTTWGGNPNPHSWLDLDPIVNQSLGGQAKRYPIGYKPTKFVFEELK